MGGTSRQMTFGYDADGNRTLMTFPDSQSFTYNYDGLDRENFIQQPGGAGVIGLSYDAAEQHQGTGRGNGVGTGYSYDGVGRLQSIGHDLVGTAGDIGFGLTYNPASQIVSRTTSNDAYAWRGASNASKSYSVNGLNQYTSVAGASYSYDANGNLTSDGSTSYVYDAENRLVSASNGTTLTYDPNGRLWQTAGGPSGTTQFLYDGDQLSAEYDGSGNLLRRYIHGTGEDDPLVWYEGSGLGSPRYYHADHEGSIVGLSDASGNPIAIDSYDEYGVPAIGNLGRFGYTGQTWLPDLGLYHYKARAYSPKLGRFLQTDPVGYKDQVNLYSYVADDPVNRTDQTGLYDCPASQCKVIGKIISTAKAALSTPVTGSLLPSSTASRGLQSLNSLGSHDGKGVVISLGPVTGEGAGFTSGVSSITLDASKLNDSAKLWNTDGIHYGAGVLAHEASHYFEHIMGRPPSGSAFMAEETRAWDIQLGVYSGLGLRTPADIRRLELKITMANCENVLLNQIVVSISRTRDYQEWIVVNEEESIYQPEPFPS